MMISEDTSFQEITNYLRDNGNDFYQNYTYDGKHAIGEGCAATVFPCRSIGYDLGS